ncbi:MAG: hypothetical protein B7Y41_02120 [Hydrogenophilales bacterium 28-61-23]|nr:MAG: hypothetical protein B7Y41_02120 [Hydrogenophilales bacterium 28-61-23]
MKLLAAISNHGLGHLAQAAPVLNALRTLQPDLELTIWSSLSAQALRARIEGRFEHRHHAADIGLIMHDAMRVDLAASHAAYQAFHAGWPDRVRSEANWLHARGFDRVFSDVAYLPLAAAAQAGIDSIALCSLNWADIAQAYLTGLPGMDAIFSDMIAGYRSANSFLQPAPSMPMPQMARRRAIAPIAALGRNRRRELMARFGLPATGKLALIGFGGIAYQGKGRLPALENVTWLTPDDWPSRSTDVISFHDLAMPFLDLLASSDLLVTKVGYGSFVEATAHAVPVLYLDRPDWPETPYLAAWLAEHGNAAVIEEQALFSNRLESVLTELWLQPRKPAIRANGAEQAALRLIERRA